MLDFLKIFGEGLLFFLGLPFILVGLVLYGLYLLFVFIFMSIKGIILFFKGKKYSLILEEDLKAEEILKNGLNNGMQAQTQNVSTSNITYHNTFNQININKENDKPLNPVDLTKVIENNSEPSGFIEGKNNEQR
ncbi:MAG: hypothetical protein MSA65_00945 [Mollicutes bacterium]|nr:hypothetical protein [Mollicutes bacterium]MDD7546384.1 hypothetical protein [Bacilli bacterium]MDY3761509.1 hypothetical protein [Candidatus Onthovivens sp.]MDD7621719.1 hypothetical protein [Bacilli bacterium]MDY5645648.1 hypothetical protein [Candidatus Onthovivens sp.]